MLHNCTLNETGGIGFSLVHECIFRPQSVEEPKMWLCFNSPLFTLLYLLRVVRATSV